MPDPGNASATLVFRPGSSLTGPHIFDDFNDLYTELQSLRTAKDGGFYTIVIDEIDVMPDPALVPAKTGGGVYDMTNVKIMGVPGRVKGYGEPPEYYTCDFDNGAHFSNLLQFEWIAIRNHNTSYPCIFLEQRAADDIIMIHLDNYADLACVSGALPFFSGDGLPAGTIVGVDLHHGSTFGLRENVAGYPVLEMPEADTGVVISLGDTCGVNHDLVAGHADAWLVIRAASDSALVCQDFDDFDGDQFPDFVSCPMSSLQLDPQYGESPATSAITHTDGSGGPMLFNHLLRLDSTSGSFTQTLPSLHNVKNVRIPGGWIALHNYGSANYVTVAAGTSDTIGGEASFRLYPGQTAWLTSDGEGDWIHMTRPSRIDSADGYYLAVDPGGLIKLGGKLQPSADNSAIVIEARASTYAGPAVLVTNGGVGGAYLSASSGTQQFARIGSDVGQSGSAGYEILDVHANESSSGSGAKKLIKARVNSDEKFHVSSAGSIDATGGLALATPPAAKTANYTLTAADFFVPFDTNTGSLTAALPAAASSRGKIYVIKHASGANTLTIDPNASELIDGASTTTVSAGSSKMIMCDGSGWFTLF